MYAQHWTYYWWRYLQLQGGLEVVFLYQHYCRWLLDPGICFPPP